MTPNLPQNDIDVPVLELIILIVCVQWLCFCSKIKWFCLFCVSCVCLCLFWLLFLSYVIYAYELWWQNLIEFPNQNPGGRSNFLNNPTGNKNRTEKRKRWFTSVTQHALFSDSVFQLEWKKHLPWHIYYIIL